MKIASLFYLVLIAVFLLLAGGASRADVGLPVSYGVFFAVSVMFLWFTRVLVLKRRSKKP